jgi:hypothetical protein
VRREEIQDADDLQVRRHHGLLRRGTSVLGFHVKLHVMRILLFFKQLSNDSQPRGCAAVSESRAPGPDSSVFLGVTFVDTCTFGGFARLLNLEIVLAVCIANFSNFSSFEGKNHPNIDCFCSFVIALLSPKSFVFLGSALVGLFFCFSSLSPFNFSSFR